MELGDVVSRTDSGELEAFGVPAHYEIKPWWYGAWDRWCEREGITLDQLMAASAPQLRAWHAAFAESLG